ncbi:MAG: PepSY-associated TM helix domain-containing protein [Corticimicrobacter sp.]|uniref:PepSY-associated TM helix domain-containing protein n=1 Tax=Corticimicrobacter sp. TaxID=2678536 RepID=UPI0032DB241C
MKPLNSSRHALVAFVTRMHFYIGLFVGPFIFIAALTGTLYVLTPQLEQYVYADMLQSDAEGPPQPLALQVEAARMAVGEDPRLFAIRPAPAPGATTRVMFTQPGLGESETRAVFVDPATLTVLGEEIVYGTSGILPLRMTLDYLHRNLLLGDLGRNYSELAASWLWIAILGGLVLWWQGGRRNQADVATRNPRLRHRRLHALIGLWLALGLVFFSATGLTWSRWAGERVDMLRNAMGWITPAITVELDRPIDAPAPTDPHAGHEGHASHDNAMIHAEHGGHSGHTSVSSHVLHAPAGEAAQLDAVLAAARAAGIDAGMLEIRPPRNDRQAWRISEIDRSWPTQVDTVAVDPATMQVTSRADFAEFPLVSKLIRWGIDAHMGVLFGVVNQVLMASMGMALMFMIVLGYRMWWSRRPAAPVPGQTLGRAWAALPLFWKGGVLLLAVMLAWCLPVMGASLVVFVLVDWLRGRLAGKRS